MPGCGIRHLEILSLILKSILEFAIKSTVEEEKYGMGAKHDERYSARYP